MQMLTRRDIAPANVLLNLTTTVSEVIAADAQKRASEAIEVDIRETVNQVVEIELRRTASEVVEVDLQKTASKVTSGTAVYDLARAGTLRGSRSLGMMLSKAHLDITSHHSMIRSIRRSRMVLLRERGYD